MTIKSGFDTSSAGLFTDLNQLQNLKGQAQTDEQAALKQVAGEFEQLFMSMMLKSMRQAGDVLAADSPFNSSDVKFFQEMYDQQLTLELSRQDSIGLADIIVRQLSQRADAVTQPESEDDTTAQSWTERMLNRALNSGPVVQSAGPAYSAPLVASEPVEVEAKSDAGIQAQSEQNADAGARLPSRFETPADFVEALIPLAEKAAAALNLAPGVLLAQAALETGWGKFVTRDVASGQSSFNLFNIKADSRWQGDAVQVQTLEYRGGVAQKEQARFRAYGSYADSFNDYVNFLQDNPRYQQALEHTANPARFVQELQAAGYATDPRYADKLERIFNGELLAGVGRGAQEG